MTRPTSVVPSGVVTAGTGAATGAGVAGLRTGFVIFFATGFVTLRFGADGLLLETVDFRFGAATRLDAFLGAVRAAAFVADLDVADLRALVTVVAFLFAFAFAFVPDFFVAITPPSHPGRTDRSA